MIKKESIKGKIYSFFGNLHYLFISFILLTAFIITLIVHVRISVFYDEYRVGDIAKRTVRAHQSIEIEDLKTTKWARDEAEKNTSDIYDYVPDMITDIKIKIYEAFNQARVNAEVNKESFERLIGKIIDESTYKVFIKERFSKRIETAILYGLSSVPGDKYIIRDKDKFDIFNTTTGEIVVKYLTKNSSTEETRRVKSKLFYRDFVTIEEVHSGINNFLEDIFKKFTLEEQKAITAFLFSVVEPNITFNKSSTLEAKKLARERVSKVIFRVKKGEVVVNKGETIEDRHIVIMTSLKNLRAKAKDHLSFLLLLLTFMLSFYSIIAYARSFVIYNVFDKKDLVMVASLMVLYTGLAKIWFFLSNLLSNYFSLPVDLFFLLFPFVSIAFILRIVKGPEIAAFVSIIISFVIARIVDMENPNFLAYLLFSNFIAIVFVIKFEKRSDIFKAGLKVGLFQLFFALIITASRIHALDFHWVYLFYGAVAGFLSAFFSSLISESLIPVLEYIFNYTTNLKLLEFASTNHALLKELLIKAPGTYQHSMIVGQLAAAGAEAIHANPMLARVGSYYHDVGKIGKSIYFIENQQGLSNPHEKLNPTMSARILVSHVKDGVKLCKEYKLGANVTSIVEQHHGSSLMRFFYEKAVLQDPNTNDLDYRYPSSKPKSREAVLVMIADSCEAACRSLESPSVTRIKNTVDGIISSMFTDGQFDEANITLKRLKIISDIYTKILVTLYHTRIEYPEVKNDINSEKRKRDKNSSKITETNGKESSGENWL